MRDDIVKRASSKLNEIVSQNENKRTQPERERRELVQSLAKEITTMLSPLISGLTAQSKADSKEIVDAIRQIKIPPAQISVPDLKIPDINVPTPKVTVNPPNVTVPEIKIPETKIDIPDSVFLKGIDRKDPLPVLMMDTKGRPFQGWSGGGGGISKAILQESSANIGKVQATFNDDASIDAFGRQRVSEPTTIFDSKQIHDNQPLFWDDQEVSGASTSTSHSTDTASTTISVAATTAGKRVRQTFRRFNYQPGKSQLIFLTGTLSLSGSGTGITAGIGAYDDNNGLFVQAKDGAVYAVKRSSASGSPVDTEVPQSSWNLDTMDGKGPSGKTLDPTKSQILLIDYEWLGVGRVRMAWVIDGLIVYFHQFVHSNIEQGVYMSTPNVPLRYEIENDGTGGAASLEHICSTVMSEGGAEDNGQVRYASTENVQVDCAVVGSTYAVKGIRLKSTTLDETVKILKTAIQVQSASDDLEWLLYWNPTVAGSPTWADETNSSVQTATGATTNAITAGTKIGGGYVASGNAQNASGGIESEVANALILGSSISGTPDEIWLAARPLTNVNTLVEGSITWREIS